MDHSAESVPGTPLTVKWRILCKSFPDTHLETALLGASKLHRVAMIKATRTVAEAAESPDHGHGNQLALLPHGSATDRNETTAAGRVALRFHHGNNLVAEMPLEEGMEHPLARHQLRLHHGNSNLLLVRITATMVAILATILKLVMVHLRPQLLLDSALSCNNTVLLPMLHHLLQMHRPLRLLQMISHLLHQAWEIMCHLHHHRRDQ